MYFTMFLNKDDDDDDDAHLSNRPQVSMGDKLINHAGVCRKHVNHKPQANGLRNSSRVLPTSQLVYQPITHRNLWYIAFI